MTAAAPVRSADSLTRLRTQTLFVLWTTYGSFYLCRANFGAAAPSMRADLGLTVLEIGLMAGAVKLGYALGQLVNGQLTERFGARRILGIGMIGSATATMLFAAAPAIVASTGPLGAIARGLGGAVHAIGGVLGLSFRATGPMTLMLLLAFANGASQAGGWPPVVKVAARWFPVEMRGRMMGVLGTSLGLGTTLAILFASFLLHATNDAWRAAFIVPALLLLVSYAHTSLRLREHPPRAAPGSDDLRHPEGLPVRDALVATLTNGRIWLLALGLFGVDAVRYGFLDWAPGHLAEVHHSSHATSALKTAVFPLAGAAGALTSGWLTDRFFQSRRAPVCAILLCVMGVLTVAYRFVVDLGWFPTVVCLALTGFCLFGAQILLVGTAAQDYAKRGATAAAAGFVDFMGHMGAFSGDVVTGYMLKHHGWNGAIAWWACAGFAAAAVVATLWGARSREDAASA
jgi:OPA family glycerol-3-phosphate transporter-like MFS transporter